MNHNPSRLRLIALCLAAALLALAACQPAAPTAPPPSPPPAASPTAPASPTSSPIPDWDIASLFALRSGTAWTYSIEQVTPGGEVAVALTSHGQFTLMINALESVPDGQYQLASAALSGERYTHPCAPDDVYTGELETWYLYDATHLYQLCTRQAALELADSLSRDPAQVTTMPEVVLPLQVDALWPAFPGIPARDDTFYQWHVESHSNYSLPSGDYTDCYRIVLATNPDRTSRLLCSGVGWVVLEYVHNGSPRSYTIQLASFQPAP